MIAPSKEFKEWQEDTARALLPMVRKLARSVAKRLQGHTRRPLLDEETFTSVGDEAITEVVNDPENAHKPLDELQALCNIVVGRKIIDEQRQVGGRRSDNAKRKKVYSLDAPGADEADTDHHYLVFVQNGDLKAKDVKDGIANLKRLMSTLPPEQYKVMCAELDYRQLGMSRPQIAAVLGKNPRTYENNYQKAQRNLEEHYPEVHQAIQEMLKCDTRERVNNIASAMRL